MTKSKKTRTDQLDEQIGFKLRLAQLAVFADIIDALKIVDLRPVDLSILLLTESNPGINQRIVGESLKIHRPNIVGMIDALSSRGLIERVADENDRRVNKLQLTPQGLEVLKQAKEAQKEHSDRIRRALEGIDLDIFSRGLTQLAKLEEYR